MCDVDRTISASFVWRIDTSALGPVPERWRAVVSDQWFDLDLSVTVHGGQCHQQINGSTFGCWYMARSLTSFTAYYLRFKNTEARCSALGKTKAPRWSAGTWHGRSLVLQPTVRVLKRARIHVQLCYHSCQNSGVAVTEVTSIWWDSDGSDVGMVHLWRKWRLCGAVVVEVTSLRCRSDRNDVGIVMVLVSSARLSVGPRIQIWDWSC